METLGVLCDASVRTVIAESRRLFLKVQGGSNMTGTDLCANKPHCAAAVRP